MRYAIMATQKYTIDIYHLLDPWGRFPRARTKHVSNIARYSHSTTTPKISPTFPSRSESPSDVVRIRKTKKKLP